jgi:hypothetical protein
MQAKSRIFREGILLFDDQTTFDEIKECCKALDERFGFKIFQIHAHRDEGYIDAETGKVKYNLHAHLTIDWTNQATGINLQGHRVKKKTESNAKNKELHRAKFLERIGTDEETVANNKKKMTKSARAKLEKKQTPLVFDSNDPSNEWHLKQSEKYDYFKMGLFEEDFALMQDVASEVLKMNRGQVKGKKGIEIQKWKALKAQETHDKNMLKLQQQENLQLEIIEDLIGDKIRIGADLNDLKFQKQQAENQLQNNKKLSDEYGQMAIEYSDAVKSNKKITDVQKREFAVVQQKIEKLDDIDRKVSQMDWLEDKCDKAEVPKEIVNGNGDSIELDSADRVRLLYDQVLNLKNYIFRKATWVDKVNDIIGGTKLLLTKAQRTSDVFVWFNKETKNLNIHKDKSKVRIESQELPIKFGVEQKLDPTAPSEQVEQPYNPRIVQKINPVQHQQTKVPRIRS